MRFLLTDEGNVAQNAVALEHSKFWWGENRGDLPLMVTLVSGWPPCHY
jgi:hypothetical protein